MIPPDTLQRLGELSSKAIPGPWRCADRGIAVVVSDAKDFRGGCRMEPGQCRVADIRGWGFLQYRDDGEARTEATAEFIAAANPSVIAALVAELAAARAVVEAARQFADRDQTYYESEPGVELLCLGGLDQGDCERLNNAMSDYDAALAHHHQTPEAG